MIERDIRLRFANLRKHDPDAPTVLYPDDHPDWVYVDRQYWRSLSMEDRIDYANFVLTPIIHEQDTISSGTNQLELAL